ncbi:MAG: radical SAM protein [Microthrixaceae bacterium]
MSSDAPYFLVATDDGLVALSRTDIAIELSPDQAQSLVAGPEGEAHGQADQQAESHPEPSGAGAGSEAAHPDAWIRPNFRIKFRCPLAMLVHDREVTFKAAASEVRTQLTGTQLRLLANAQWGFDADELTVRVLGSILDSGYFYLDDETGGDADGASGYLRPVAADPKADDIGSPAADGLVPVYSICSSHIAGVPLALGMLGAAMRAHDSGSLIEHFDFRPLRRETSTTLAEINGHPVPSVFLFSNYVWSIATNLELSKQVKTLCPGSLIIHGGPSTPKYEADARTFLDRHPEIDVLVNGEGEVTIVEIMERLTSGLDPDRLLEIPGTIVRSSDGGIHIGPPRQRVAELSDLPSAYLTGLFDHLDGGLLDLMPLETNRGCPYACAFCDWGSATMSRVRSFPLERVFAELDWIAEHNVGTLFIADANFGMLPRDLEIAKYIAQLKSRLGAPRAVLVSFAKNQTLRAAEIVKTWIDAGIATEGSVALQTTSEETLQNINRKNIRIERYDELTEEFRKLGLPLAVDLMLGLPGSTVDAFAADLQKCIDGELTARIYPTVVLPNSPMNSPEYRAQNRIRVDASGIVVEAASFDDADYAEMLRLRRIYRTFDHFGVLRHVARWAQYDCGVSALELYRAIDGAVSSEPRSWPNLHWMAQHFAHFTVPPPDWDQFLGETRRILVERLGIAESSALDTVLAVQAAHLPVPWAEFPRRVLLDHDYVAWFRSLHSSEEAQGRHEPLREFGSGSLEVEDPRGICTGDLTAHLRVHPHPDVDSVMSNEFWIADDWELTSPVMRRIPQVLMETERSF